MLLCLQKESEDHQGAVLCFSQPSIVDHNGAFLVTGVVLRDIRALRMASV